MSPRSGGQPVAGEGTGHTDAEPLAAGRSAYDRRAWASARTHLLAADETAPLGTDDLDRLARASFLSGHDDEAATVFARLYRRTLREHPRRAARAAFWIGFVLTQRGRAAEAGAWLERGLSVLDGDEDAAERGLLLVPLALQRAYADDGEGAVQMFRRALEIGERTGDPDLCALARLGTGRALLMLGDATAAMTHMDEAMVAVTTGEVSPMIAGMVYCAMIGACRIVLDVPRAQEWTSALDAWCAAQPELVPYRGQCLVHRSQVLQLHGAWAEASEQARSARVLLSTPPPQGAAGDAWYEEGELHRLRGELTAAEECYRRTSAFGRQVQPGLALLRCACGDAPAAAQGLDRALAEATDAWSRPPLLAARVHVALVQGDLTTARTSAAQLAGFVEERDNPYLRALTLTCQGAVDLADGEPRVALGRLRTALATWGDLDAPYERARTHEAIGLACRDLGDRDGAELELAAAREGFAALGARPDVERLDRLSRTPADPGPATVLSAREVEVLRLVSAGHTNRAIATSLTLSEKTVARHVSNILTKLDLPSRAAATAWAYEHAVVHPAPPTR